MESRFEGRFGDRVVMVTGAAQGIGAEIAAAFKRDGALVEIADIDGAGVAARGEELGVAHHVLDLSRREESHGLVAEVAARHGRLEVLVNAAGGVAGQTGRPIEEIAEADWRVLFEANLDGAFWLSQAAAPHMKRAGYGRIVNIASGAGLRPSLTGIQAYTAAKHALVGLTRQLSWELGPHGITVNAIAPGLVLSNPTSTRQWESYGPEGQKQVLDSIHTRRLGTPEDIANAALFLAEAASGWITGQVLAVDGGRS